MERIRQAFDVFSFYYFFEDVRQQHKA